MEYDWKPGPEWERLRELEAVLGSLGPSSLQDEVPRLIERTFEGLGFSKAEADVFAASEAGQRRYVLEARSRIRNGSRRLGVALIAAGDFADQGRLEEAKDELRRVLRSETVRFYRELAENELNALE